MTQTGWNAALTAVTLSVGTCLVATGCAAGNPRHSGAGDGLMGWRLPAADAADEHDDTDLAKQTQNPVADLVSVPFQLNSNFDTGPRDNTQQVLNIQPVVPQRVDDDWNWIHRAIIPLIDQPSLAPGVHSTSGLGNVLYQGFLSPAHPEGAIWGVGPVVQLPTAESDRLGPDEWGLGPAFVILRNAGPWVVGTLATHVWGTENHAQTNLTTVQPFVNYNFEGGWYLTSAPIMTANWEASDGGNIWTVPLGGGAGRTFRIGSQPVNVSLQAFSNVQRPHGAPEWSTRLQFALLFPKHKPRGAVN